MNTDCGHTCTYWCNKDHNNPNRKGDKIYLYALYRHNHNNHHCYNNYWLHKYCLDHHLKLLTEFHCFHNQTLNQNSENLSDQDCIPVQLKYNPKELIAAAEKQYCSSLTSFRKHHHSFFRKLQGLFALNIFFCV